jgi:pullulanase
LPGSFIGLHARSLRPDEAAGRDWFNKIDWSGTTANWGIRLPLASQNGGQWSIMTPLVSNPVYTPRPENIAYSSTAFREFMQIRFISRLFRMSTFAEVQQNLTFLNTGPNQTPGLIVMKLDANGGDYGTNRNILVVFNATNEEVTFTDAILQGIHLHLHPCSKALVTR